MSNARFIPLVSTTLTFVFGFLGSLTHPLMAQTRRLDMGFAGQMASAVKELKEKMVADPDINGRKLRLGKFSGPNLPDSSFEQEFERSYRRLMGGLLTNESPLVVNGEYKILPGDLDENHDLQVIQFEISIQRRFRVLQAVTREINRSEDITRIAGTTVALPDSAKIEVRNKAAYASMIDPQYELRDQHFVVAQGHDAHRVAIMKMVQGQGKPVPVVPRKVNGYAFVDLDVGDTFSIVLANHDPKCDASADVSIDGLDVANTFSIDKTRYKGYLVPRLKRSRSGRHTVPGWLKTTKEKTNNVYEFVLNKLGHGAATEMESRNNLGVIHVAFFEAVPPDETLPSRKFGEVGRGDLMDVKYKTVPMTRRESPIAQISIRYRNPSK